MPELTPDEARRAAYYEETQTEKIIRKAQKNPFVPLGVAGFVGMLAYGAYDYKHKGSMKTSTFLMHLRVKSQSMVVGAITIGVAFALGQRIYTNYTSKKA